MNPSIRAYRTTQDERKSIIYLRFVSLIATYLIFTTPCLHAGLDSWISSILPEKMRASETMRSSIYAAKDHLKIKKPVLVMHESLDEDTLAHADNYLPFSIIKVNNNALADQGIERQKRTGYHEAGHVLHNHWMVDNTIQAISTPSYISAMLTSWYGFMRRGSLTPLRKHAILATSAASWATAFLTQNHIPDYTTSTLRKRELEADAVAFSLMGKLDGPAHLENTLAWNDNVADLMGLDFRIRTDVHPTIGEESAMIRAVLGKKTL